MTTEIEDAGFEPTGEIEDLAEVPGGDLDESAEEATALPESMQEREEEPAPERLVVGEYDSVPVANLDVELRFEVGSTSLGLEELAALQPGYCFELNAPSDEPVTVYANGKKVGTGSLVDVGGRIAVRLARTGE